MSMFTAEDNGKLFFTKKELQTKHGGEVLPVGTRLYYYHEDYKNCITGLRKNGMLTYPVIASRESCLYEVQDSINEYTSVGFEVGAKITTKSTYTKMDKYNDSFPGGRISVEVVANAAFELLGMFKAPDDASQMPACELVLKKDNTLYSMLVYEYEPLAQSLADLFDVVDANKAVCTNTNREQLMVYLSAQVGKKFRLGEDTVCILESYTFNDLSYAVLKFRGESGIPYLKYVPSIDNFQDCFVQVEVKESSKPICTKEEKKYPRLHRILGESVVGQVHTDKDGMYRYVEESRCSIAYRKDIKDLTKVEATAGYDCQWGDEFELSDEELRQWHLSRGK